MRQVGLTLSVFVILAPMVLVLPAGRWHGQEGTRVVAFAEAAAKRQEGRTVWGKIKWFNSDYVAVDERTYTINKPRVVIDTYSLKPHEKGNVRLTLDERGLVVEIFFYGIDMPDVFDRYRM